MKKFQGGFSNFWYYYKFKLLLLALILIIVVCTVQQCVQNTNPDLGVLYVSEGMVSDQNNMQLQKTLQKSNVLADADEDDSIRVNVRGISIPKNSQSQDEMMALQQLQVFLVSGDYQLLIMDEESIYSYKNQGVFGDITQLAEQYNIPEQDLYYSDDRKIIGIAVSGNKLLSDCKFNTDKEFIAVRAASEKDAAKIEYANAQAALEYILQNK